MRQIIALGGGGFSMEENTAFDRYIVDQAGKANPRVCFLPTASGDADSYVLKFYQAFSGLDCRPSTLSLFRPPTTDLENFVLEKDVIYVGGGNTRSMLCLWREWGLDHILQRAYQAGVMMAGISAGGVCWFEQCITDSYPGELRMLPCLGFLSGSFSPHYDSAPGRRPTFHRLVQTGMIKSGFAADNSAGIHFIDEQPVAYICSFDSPRVYHVRLENGKIIEEEKEMKRV
jgi:dipeptidase E